MNCPNCNAKNIELIHDYGTFAGGGPCGEYARDKYYTFKCENCHKKIHVVKSISVTVEEWDDNVTHTYA